MRSRWLTILAVLLFIPSLAWAPTQVAPTGGGAAPVNQTTTDSGYGKVFYTSERTVPGAAIFIDDLNLIGFYPITTTEMGFYQSSDGGRTWALTRSLTGFPASAFGTLLQVLGPTSSGRIFFVMSGSTGGLSYTVNPSGNVASGWVIGPAGGGVQDGIGGAIGPNGTIAYLREAGGVRSVCRSTNDGTTWSCNTVTGAAATSIANTMVSPVAGTWMFINNDSIWRSTDDAVSFQRWFNLANGGNGMSCITPTICLAAAGGVSAATIYRSTDSGSTWNLQATMNFTWSPTGSLGSIPLINFGGGVVVALTGNTITAASAGIRSTDFGLTWQPLPVYNVVPGGTNSRGYTGAASRGGRAVAFHATNEIIVTQVYSPLLGAGQTQIGDSEGNTFLAGSGCAGKGLQDVTYTNISTTASVQLITGTANRRLSLCHINLVTAGANNVAFVEGTGAVCATGIAGLFGGTTAATGWNLAANGSMVLGDGKGVIRRTAVNGNNVCVLVSAAVQLSGVIGWTVE